MSTSPNPYYFMSYSREDTANQRKIINELRERGIDIWVDIEHLVPGAPTWEREIERAIRESTGVVVLLSPESNNSEWVRRELSFAEQHRKRIFPALIEGDDDTSTPLRLASHQRVDLRSNYEEGLDELAHALKDYIEVKDDIARKSQVNIKIESKAKPAADLKKYGLPALIALVGLVCIGGIVGSVQLIGKLKGPTQTATTPPTLVGAITETPMKTATNTGALPGKIVLTCQIKDLNDNELCIMNADGSGWRQLTNSGYTSYYGSFSPDGQRIVFANNRTGNMEIYEMDLDGHTTQLTDLKSDLAAPEISPDNQFIVFTNQVKGNGQIWIMNRDGSNPHMFYRANGTDALDPTWSPDWTKILFAVGGGETKQLYTRELTGGEPHLISNLVKTRGRSDWSQQDLITYYSNGPWEREVFVINPDGSDMRQLTKGGNSQGPSFSPDGKWITFTAYTNVADKDENSCEIFVMHVDGTNIRQLTKNSYCDYQPRWGN